MNYDAVTWSANKHHSESPDQASYGEAANLLPPYEGNCNTDLSHARASANLGLPCNIDIQDVNPRASRDWTDLRDRRNIALPLSYFCVGYLPSFVSTPLTVYLVRELNAHPQVQSSLNVTLQLPWALKLLCGFASDAFPINGERRRPYILIGYALCCAGYFLLAWARNPSAPQLASLLLLSTLGMVMADTVCDSMVVARSRHESNEVHGHLQSSCYLCRFFGGVVGAILGTVAYHSGEWGWQLSFGQVMFVSGLLPLVIVFPALHSLAEMLTRGQCCPAVTLQLQRIWQLVQRKAVWRPMAFIFTYNLFQVSNAAWSSYLQLTLQFPPVFIGSLRIAGTVMTFIGVFLYKSCFFRASWRSVYIFSTILNTVFSACQLILIFQINLKVHLSSFLFSLGDDTLQALLAGLQFLPICIQYLRLCPEGTEGLSFAVLSTFGNIGLLCAQSCSTLLTQVWDVSNAALQQGELGGLWRLSLLTSCVSALPLVLLHMLPANSAEQQADLGKPQSSRPAGAIFLLTLGIALSWVIGQGVWLLGTDRRG